MLQKTNNEDWRNVKEEQNKKLVSVHGRTRLGPHLVHVALCPGKKELFIEAIRGQSASSAASRA